MTDDNTAPEADQPATPDPEVSTPEDTDEVPEDQDAAEPTKSEAVKYRRRLRETEKQRDELAARVENIQRQQVETLLGRERMTPKALWAVTELADLLTDDGLVDPVKVRTAAENARKELGLGTGLRMPSERKVSKPVSGNTFATAFTPPTPRKASHD